MADIAELRRIVEPEVEALGLSLVRVQMIGGGDDPTLQVMAERPDTRQLSLGDCEALSRRLSDALDRADPIPHHYRLEVSSPGIDRPLTRRADFDDWKGHEARIRLSAPIGGRRQFTGTLRGTKGDEIRLDLSDAGEIRLPFDRLHSAKLVLTDRLIAATHPLSHEGADEILEQQD